VCAAYADPAEAQGGAESTSGDRGGDDVLPSAWIRLAHTDVEGRAGTAAVYTGSDGCLIPVSVFQHLMYRPPETARMNMMEFLTCTETDAKLESTSTNVAADPTV